MRNVRIAAAAAAVLAVTVAACSSGSKKPDSAKPSDISVPGAPASINSQFQSLYAQAIASHQKSLTIYQNGCPASTLAFYKAFSKRFPGMSITCASYPDSVAAAKLEAESSSGKHIADIYLSGSNGIVSITQQPNICATPTVFSAQLPSKLVLQDGRELIYGNSGFGFVYNTDKVSPSDAPKSWSDLLDPKWKNKMEMGSPLVTGGPRQVLANMLIPANQARYGTNYLDQLAAQHVTLSATEAPVATDIASGRFEIGLIVIKDFYSAVKAKGGPVGFVFPLQSGNYLVQLALCQIKGASHSDAARLFVNWLYSQEGQALQASIEGVYGALPDAPGPQGAPSLGSLDQIARLPVTNTSAYQPYYDQLKTIFK